MDNFFVFSIVKYLWIVIVNHNLVKYDCMTFCYFKGTYYISSILLLLFTFCTWKIRLILERFRRKTHQSSKIDLPWLDVTFSFLLFVFKAFNISVIKLLFYYMGEGTALLIYLPLGFYIHEPKYDLRNVAHCLTIWTQLTFDDWPNLQHVL